MSDPRSWLPDPSHYPEQMTPLSASVWFEALGRGLHEATRELRAPFGGFLTRTGLGWAYEGELEPDWEPDPERLRAHALGLAERWERELRPRVHALTAEIETLRPEAPPPAEAAALLDRLRERVRETWTIHFLVVIPAQVAAELLHDAFSERFGDGDPLAAYRLVEGVEHEPDRAVRALAGRARDLGVADIVCELAAEHALGRLRASGPGRRWLHELDAYLLRFGGRARWHELSLPREAEQPAMTLEAVRLLLEAPDPAPPAARDAVPPELAELYARVQPAYALKELHTYDIDYPSLQATREALLGFGRRLAAEGMLEAVEDVWMLELGELRAAVAHGDPDLRALVARRREELAEGLRRGPAPYLGEPPADVERHQALEKFYGSGGEALAGAGASPGVAEGTARVVSGPEDFARVRAGDVLVTTTTTPAWTPLFGSLAALVTETGGILSHAAVVAREHGIPAVVGASGATAAVPDGARVRVDGASGAVTILHRPVRSDEGGPRPARR